MGRAAHISRAAARAFRVSAAARATPMAPLEPHNHLEPVYAAIDDRLNTVRKKYVPIHLISPPDPCCAPSATRPNTPAPASPPIFPGSP